MQSKEESQLDKLNTKRMLIVSFLYILLEENLVIYSKKLRNILLERGFKEIKPPEYNIQHSDYLVFFFDDSPEIKRIVDEYINRSKK